MSFVILLLLSDVAASWPYSGDYYGSASPNILSVNPLSSSPLVWTGGKQQLTASGRVAQTQVDSSGAEPEGRDDNSEEMRPKLPARQAVLPMTTERTMLTTDGTVAADATTAADIATSIERDGEIIMITAGAIFTEIISKIASMLTEAIVNSIPNIALELKARQDKRDASAGSPPAGSPSLGGMVDKNLLLARFYQPASPKFKL